MKLFDGRPNGELLLATGTMEPTNPADLLTMNASLIAADRLYSTKREILTTFGFGMCFLFIEWHAVSATLRLKTTT